MSRGGDARSSRSRTPPRATRSGLVGVALAGVWLLLLAGPASGQSRVPVDGPVTLPPPAAAAAPSLSGFAGAPSPLLPPGHWAVRAAARLEAMGLAPGYLPAQSAVPRSAVAAAIREASVRVAERTGSGAARPSVQSATPGAGGDAARSLVEGWRRRFAEEFPEHGDAPPNGAAVRLLGGSLAAGGEWARGFAGPGTHLIPEERTGATPLDELGGGAARGDLAVVVGGRGLLSIVPAVSGRRARIDRGEAVVRWGSARASVGRAEVGWGTGRGGGVVFSGLPLDRIEVSTAAPVRLPWLLRWLGPFAIHTFAARLPEDRHPGPPVLIGSSASARPHPRFTLSGHRALMLGGAEVDEKMRLGEILPALIGKNVAGADQIASTSARLRLPTERWIPISVYCEWGAEDSAGAPFDSPGLVCGGVSPTLPGIPAISLGLEHAQFGAAPVNGPPWYRHLSFPGGWAMDEAPLGHPLGGEGRQWLVYSEASTLDGRLELDGTAFHRERTGDNLFMPGRPGESAGFTAGARWRIQPASDLVLSVAGEWGADWDALGVAAFWRLLF